MNNYSDIDVIEKYKLTKEQAEAYLWLKNQKLNTDDGTLSYWVKKYPLKRVQEVVEFAKARLEGGQNIKNIGGWINKFLKNNLIIVNGNCKINREILSKFLETAQWNDLLIYEKYIRDSITGDDLPLTIIPEDFKRHLKALYQKSQLYK